MATVKTPRVVNVISSTYSKIRTGAVVNCGKGFSVNELKTPTRLNVPESSPKGSATPSVIPCPQNNN